MTDGERMNTDGCPRIAGSDMPFCELATQAALARLSIAGDAESHVKAARECFETDPGLARAHLRSAAEVLAKAKDGIAPEVVPYDEVLQAVVGALQDTVSAEPIALLQMAQEASSALTSAGWVLVRQEGLP